MLQPTDSGQAPADGSVAMPAIVVHDLRKTYGDHLAVDGLGFSVEEGEVFGLLGPNGAGKTTTVEILEGHRERSGGTVEVLGFDPATGGRAYRERIGIVLQEAGMEEEFTVRELVTLYAGFYPRPRPADEVIELVGLGEKRQARTKTLSGGQRRRLDLALGLVGDPDLLFLDEPTTGFDPSARRRAWDVVANLCGVGKTVLLTTHYMEEAAFLADRVAVIAGGRLVALGTPAELAAGSRRGGGRIRFRAPAVGVPDLPRIRARLEVIEGIVELQSSAPTQDLQALTSWAVTAGVELEELTIAPPSFEETYLELVGHTEGTSDG
jgi:ABC-2 type transport system ATP-binding protein